MVQDRGKVYWKQTRECPELTSLYTMLREEIGCQKFMHIRPSKYQPTATWIHSSVKRPVSLVMPTVSSGVAMAAKQLTKFSRERFNAMPLSMVTPMKHCRRDGSSKWGTCKAICTFNLNKLAWQKLSDWVDVLAMEIAWSVVALQEIFEETGLVDDGWWNVGKHFILVSRSHANMLHGLLLNSDYAPISLPDFVVHQYSVVTTIMLGHFPVRFAAVYWPTSGMDQIVPGAYGLAQQHVLECLAGYQHRIIVGDYNCWLGSSKIEGVALGPYNLDKVNDRGQETLALLQSVGMRVTSTKLRHTLLATRGGWRGEASSIDYVACSRAIHELFCQCDVFPVASKSDHYMVRVQLKQHFPRQLRRGSKKEHWWENDDFRRVFLSSLPSDVPETLDGWQSEVSKAMGFARSIAQPLVRPSCSRWDARAWELRDAGNSSQGRERQLFSKLMTRGY
eukprot:5844248-Amphidinium_carterae.1